MAFCRGLNMARHSSHILDLARQGAEARFRELIDEARLLVESFPHLRDAFDPDELPISFLVARGSGQLTAEQPGRRRQRMSAAVRKAASDRMKVDWTGRRAGKK